MTGARRWLLAAGCCALGACGGGDDEPTTEQKRYVRQLDAVCLDAQRFQDEMERKAEDVADRADTVRPVRERNEGGKRFLRRYRAIEAPPPQRDFHGRLVATVEAQVKITGEGLRAVEANDEERYARTTDDLTRVAEERRRLKPGLKFKHCFWRRPATE